MRWPCKRGGKICAFITRGGTAEKRKKKFYWVNLYWEGKREVSHHHPYFKMTKHRREGISLNTLDEEGGGGGFFYNDATTVGGIGEKKRGGPCFFLGGKGKKRRGEGREKTLACRRPTLITEDRRRGEARFSGSKEKPNSSPDHEIWEREKKKRTRKRGGG